MHKQQRHALAGNFIVHAKTIDAFHRHIFSSSLSMRYSPRKHLVLTA
jgi:hypothetical protein